MIFWEGTKTMKKTKSIFLGAALACMALVTGCGGGEVETVEAHYDMTFANETGLDVTKLEIRAAEDSDWLEIALAESVWEDSYEIPVTLSGQIPVAENGWEAQLTFADGETTATVNGLHFADGVTFDFTLEGSELVATPEVEAEETPAEDETSAVDETSTESEAAVDDTPVQQ